MDGLIEPNLHPIFVHFVVGLLFTSAIVLAVGAFAPSGTRWRSPLVTAGDWMLALGLVAAVGAVIAGFEAYYTVAHDGPSHAAMTTHRNWALAAAGVFLALGVWRWMRRPDAPGPLFALAGIAAAALLTVTAWWGGVVVFEHGVGVQSLPEASGDGHDHDHGDGGHGDGGHGDGGHGEAGHHDAGADSPAGSSSDGHHDGEGTQQGDHAHDGGEAHDHGAQAGADQRENGARLAGTPGEVADAFHAALASSNEGRVRALLSGDVVILEGGGAERSLEQYASHHMMSDMAFLSSVESEQLSRTSQDHGETAWVATETALRGTYDGREVAVKSQETLVLRREGEGWVIEHVHWSNSALGEDDVPQATQDEEEHDHSGHEH